MQNDLTQIGIIDLLFIPVFLLGCIFLYPTIIRMIAPGHSRGLLKLAWLRMACVIPGFVFATQFGSMDCQSYWRWPSQGISYFSVGTILGSTMVEYFMFPFAWWLKLNFFSCFLPFAALSSLGTIFLGATLIRLNNNAMPRLGWVLLSLPNIMIWCSLPGKDIMMWFFGSLLLYSIFCMRGGAKTGFVIFISLAGMFAFRPHIAVTSMAAIVFVLIFSPKGNSWVSRHRTVIFLLTFCSFIAVLPLVKNYVQIDDWTNMSEYSERIKDSGEKYDASREGEASSIDLSGASPITKMFAFMYRPLFFDAHNAASLFASFENIFLLGVTCMICFKKRLWASLFMQNFNSSLVFYLGFLGWIILANAGGNNLGLFAREKVQLMPFFITLICLIVEKRVGFGRK